MNLYLLSDYFLNIRYVIRVLRQTSNSDFYDDDIKCGILNIICSGGLSKVRSGNACRSTHSYYTFTLCVIYSLFFDSYLIRSKTKKNPMIKFEAPNIRDHI